MIQSGDQQLARAVAKKNHIQVTAAIIIRSQDNKILVAQRKKNQHMGLKWEFPGGKIRSGETPEACLVRELREEFAVETRIREFFHRNVHHYPGKSIELISFLVDYLEGDFKLNDHEAIHWLTLDEMEAYDFAAADLPIVEKLYKTGIQQLQSTVTRGTAATGSPNSSF